MSDEAMNAIAQRLAADPELRERVMSATTGTERREVLAGAGLTIPTHEEFQAWQTLADVAGGQGSLQLGAGTTFHVDHSTIWE